MAWTMRRHAARVVLLDRARRHVFMIHASDPADRSKRDWWETPGGGIHHGEESGVTAMRELYEEAGIVDAEVGPCVATQQVEFDFGGLHFDQDERVHVAWIDEMPADARPQGLEALEVAAFMGSRWWPVDELLSSDVPVLPVRLRELLPILVAGALPADPIDLTPPTDLVWP
jgi:8-oxo-dGTP pyrophosphatase MutT (NUDIX family)